MKKPTLYKYLCRFLGLSLSVSTVGFVDVCSVPHGASFFPKAQAATRSPQSAGAPNPVRPEGERINKARLLAADGKTDDAVSDLAKAIEQETAKDRRALLKLASANILFQAARDQQAEEMFAAAIADGLRVPDIAHYHLGLLKQKAGKGKEARAEFEKVIALKPPQATEVEARLQIARSLVAESQWKSAIPQLEQLRKKLKNDTRYPEVAFALLRAEKKSGRRSKFCELAREIYAKYPAPSGPGVAEILTWGPHLDRNLIEGEKSGCTASHKDLKTRVRRLWLSGEEARAESELKNLKDEEDEDGNSLVDSMMVNHLVAEARTDEALKILMSKYEANRGRPAYLLLLAKAASAAGEYQMAINSYQRAYELAPRGKNGPSSLFQAAFTSYQIQDYDGATRRFEQLIKSNHGSKFARDAEWHLAWIRYLRGDYNGALESFKSLAKAPKRATKRRKRGKASAPAETVSQDRIQYWTAMSLLRLGKTAEAQNAFQALVRDPSIGYYAMLAYYRLQTIPGAKVSPEVEARLGLKSVAAATANEEELKEAAALSAEAAQAEFADDLKSAAEKSDSSSDDQDESDDEEESSITEAPHESLPAGFKDPKLAVKFERARDLATVGLDDLARRELLEIEKRARSTSDRKLLMTEYAMVKSYERSSYIGEIGFGPARLRTGLKGESRVYWEFAYPRAWEDTVKEASKATAVPEEMIWGIMRAESHYRYDAQSPVGALGLMQLMPFTGRKVADLLKMKEFDPHSLLIPEMNIRLGSRYLQRLFEKFSARVPLVAASYNAGPHRVQAWVRNFGSLEMDEFIEHIPFLETRNYVKRVVRNFQIYGLLYKPAHPSLTWLIQPVGVTSQEPTSKQEVW